MVVSTNRKKKTFIRQSAQYAYFYWKTDNILTNILCIIVYSFTHMFYMLDPKNKNN